MEALDHLFDMKRRTTDQMAGHMVRLRELASQCSVAVEFGVRRASSTVALLASGCRVHSYDIEDRYPQVTADIARLAGDRWSFTIGSSLEADIPKCDLLLHDSWHTCGHVFEELMMHEGKVDKFICLHDTVSHGLRGQSPQVDGKLGTHSEEEGVMHAVVDFLRRHRQWRERAHYGDHSGLLVLERT